MKRIFAWILLVIMLVGTLAGCGCQKRQDPDPTGTTAPVAGDTNIQDVIEYLKAIYKDDGAETYVDFERFGIVRIAGVPYEVVWTVDVTEDLVKVIVNDDGTVTIDVNEKCEKATPYVLTATVTGEDGSTASHSWNYILPEAVDMVAIVKAAYALANGESMDYEVTLTGEITKIDTPYSEEYKNITVTIVVEGAEDMPIQCYRLKGDGADELQIGDTITVTGTLKNYNGTIEFDAGCILESVVPGERVKAPDDPKQIVDEAYALGANQSLKYEATLTGKITQIKDPYSEQYQNVTVVMVVAGRENKPITCYRMKGAGADDLDVGDTITVKGYITNYVGSAGYSTIEFTAGCQLISYENTGKEFVMPSTAAGIVNLAYSLKEGEALPEQATLTGVVTTVDTAYSSQYKNVTVTMVVGNMYDKPITCYRLKGTGADVIDEGYTITVTGILKNYYGKIEFDSGCTLDSYKAPAKPEGPAVSYEGTVVDAPKVDTPYKLGLVQKNIAGEPTLYFSGNLANSYYLSTSKDGAKAVDVMLKAAKGGYYLAYTAMGGATKYINMVQVTTDKLHTNLAISDKPQTVYTYDTALKTLTVKMPDGNTYYIGTYSEYTTLSASDVTKINGSFPAYFMELKTVSGPASMEEGVKQLKTEYPNGYKDDYTLPTSVQVRDDVFAITWKVVTDNPEAVAIKSGKLVFERQVDEVPYKLVATLTKGSEKTDVEWEYAVPRKPAAIEVVTNPQIGKAYRLALTQGNLDGSVLFLNGEKSGNYFATSDKSYEGVDVYAEKAGDGIRIYFMDGDVKTYVDMYEWKADNIGVDFHTELTETSAIYKIDTEKKALIATFDIAGAAESRYLGTYNNFTTMSSGKIYDGEIDGFPAMFVIVNEETPVTLNAAAQELQKELPETGSKTPTGFDVPDSVVLNKTTFKVTWSITPANSAAVQLTHVDADGVYNVAVTQGFEDVGYTLKATIEDPAGQTKDVTWEYTVPAKVLSTIAQAQAGAKGDFFEVKGVVTLVEGQNIYIQDATGGICLRFATAPTDINLGDTVVGAGTKDTYNGLVQLTGATYVKSSGMNLSAKTTTIGALTAADVGTYVKITGLTVTEVFDNNGAYSSPNITMKDSAGNTIQLYKAVVGKTGGEWDVKVGDVLDVTAAVSIYYENLQLRNTSASEITVVTSGTTDPSDPSTDPSTEPSTDPSTEPSTEPTNPAATYTLIDRVADLVAGTYKMGAYSTASGNYDFSANPYHLWDGTLYTSGSNSDLATNTYKFENGDLEKVVSTNYASDKGDAADVELVAVPGKTNTYYIMVGEQYLGLSDAANNRKFALSATASEWVATDHGTGGILMTTTVSEANAVFGTSTGSSNVVRSYKEASAGSLKYGVVFFKDNTQVPVDAYTLVERIIDLVAGTYKMGAYSTASGNYDFSANPYHLWDGTLYTSGSNSDLATNTYKFENGDLEKVVVEGNYASDKGDAADVELVAVPGKTNTYYIMVGEQYLGLSDAANNRKFALSATASEWVATDHGTGGILMTTTVSGANAVFGTSTGSSNVVRSYKEASAGSLKYGVVFFKANGAATPTPPVEATLDDAAEALKTLYPNGYGENYALADSIEAKGTQFTITKWEITAVSVEGAAKIESNTLVLTPKAEAATYTLTATISDGTNTKTVDFNGTVEAEEPAGTATYTLIDRVADLVAGTYKMGAYSTASGNYDFSANPYHLWDGTLYTSGSNSDLATNTYKFENGDLEKVVSTNYASDKGDAADVELVAVPGKTNTYYIMVGEQYLGLSDAANNRKFALSATASEWVATDHGTGGIMMTTTVSGANAVFGTSTGSSNVVRSYKEASAGSLKYGVVFFKDNTQIPADAYTLVERIIDLVAGTYKMGAYSTASGNYDFSANPYHLWDGTLYTSGSNSDLATNTYKFENGDLEKVVVEGNYASDKGDAANVELVAVPGKTNTYYIMVGEQYLGLSDAANNRKFALSATASEWVATDHGTGGIMMTTTVSGANAVFGTSTGSSNVVRSYKEASAGSLKYGVVFFKANG